MRLILGTPTTQLSGAPGEFLSHREYRETQQSSHLKGKIFFGDSTLNRQGFAAVAIAAGVPIIPVFTENIREATLCLSGRMNVGRGLWEQIYEKTKMPLVPMYGLFPVKLRTHLGKPIFPKPGFYS